MLYFYMPKNKMVEILILMFVTSFFKKNVCYKFIKFYLWV